MAFRGTFSIESSEGPRWAAALDLFRDGQSITYRDVQFTLAPGGAMHAITESAWADPSRADRVSLSRELDRAEATIASLRADAPQFDELVRRQRVVVELVSSYGMGSVLVATRIDGTTVWADH